jgi:transcriptional regulator with XRE-family HTH domain
MASRSAATLGEIIRQQRELAEMSMRQFAQVAGISNPYLSQIERGLRAPSQQVLDGIASALKMSSDALYEQAGMPLPGDDDGPVSGVIEAIDDDPLLTSRQRAALKEIYGAFVATSPRARQAAR